MLRTFAICPQEQLQRQRMGAKHFAEQGLTVEIFNSLNAGQSGVITRWTYEVDDPGSGFMMGPKPVNIWLGHWGLWQTLQYLPEQHFLILEIDARFPEQWRPRIENALRNVPADFDFLFIGSCCTKGRPTTPIAPEIFEVKWPMCLHAYIVSKKVLPLMISTLRKVWAPIDIQLTFELFYKLEVKCYTVLPRIVGQFDTEIPE